MKGDFSRDTFNPLKHFNRVLMQQGRVQLDADWNEQQDINLHLLRTFIKDLIGPFGTPCNPEGKIGTGFYIKKGINAPFTIGWGNYYVDGILCENNPVNEIEESLSSLEQDDFPFSKDFQGSSYLVYLDVWERHISSFEDDEIREKALGGPDTASRSKVVWQVRTESIYPKLMPKNAEKWKDWIYENWKNFFVEKWQSRNRGSLRARVKPDEKGKIIENRLYRVEIHQGGMIKERKEPTFKWSRKNGSVVFPIIKPIEEDINSEVTIVTLGHIGAENLSVGDWVEIIDDAYVLLNQAKPLLKVISIDELTMQVTLSGTTDLRPFPEKNHPLLRRWDQKESSEVRLNNDGTIDITEVTQNDTKWIPLEDGIEIQFITSDSEYSNATYRTGDYWLIPARSITHDVEWPTRTLPPHGITHHYAPLAIFQTSTNPIDLRLKININCH